MRRDWGSVFAPNVKDSRLDAESLSSPAEEGTGWV